MPSPRKSGFTLIELLQDYDETFPYIRFHAASAEKGRRCYVWKNAVAP